MATLRFVALLKCDNENYIEHAAVAGDGKYLEFPNDDMTHISYEAVFYPSYFNPSPRLISIPDNCPESVVLQLQEAFKAAWGDFASAGNHIRKAAERLLDELHIQKTTTNSVGKRTPLTLHHRITKMKARFPEAHDSLLAIKWLGNAGSHRADLSRDAVFDALDIFESVLVEVFSKQTNSIKKIGEVGK